MRLAWALSSLPILIATGCGESWFGPARRGVDAPAIAADEAPSSIERLDSDDLNTVVAWLDRRISPLSVRQRDRDYLSRATVPAWAHVVQFETSRVLGVVRHEADRYCAAVLPRRAGRTVPSVDWVDHAIDFEGPTERARGAWYRAVARRLGSTGLTRGILHYVDGRAVGVVIELRRSRETDTEELELVIRGGLVSHAEEVGSDWGAALDGITRMSVTNTDDHDGLTLTGLLAHLDCAGGG